jgi:hypothetical protein
MDISILGYKLNLEVLILIGVIYLIMVGHTIGSCCNVGGIMEGLTTAAQAGTTAAAASLTQQQQQRKNMRQNIKANMAAKASTTKEGFVGANTNYGESSLYSLSNNNPINTSSWMAPNMNVVPGQPLSAGVKAMLNRQPQPVPLPEGELLMFANTPFKPECCPNTFSNSSGCACMTTEQYNYLILRGGNNVPYSEY